DTLLNDGRRIDGIVQHDRHALLDVVAGDPLEFPSTLGIEGDRDVRIIELANRHTRIAQYVAGQHDPPLDQVGDAIFTSRIFFHGSIEEALTAIGKLAFSLLQDVRLSVFGYAGGKIHLHLVVLIQHLELEQGRFFDEILGPLRILDTGELYNDLLQSLPLHKRFRDAKLVDAVPDRFQRLIDGGILDALAFGVPQFPDDRIGGAGGLVFAESRKIIDHFLNLRLQLGIL